MVNTNAKEFNMYEYFREHVGRKKAVTGRELYEAAFGRSSFVQDNNFTKWEKIKKLKQERHTINKSKTLDIHIISEIVKGGATLYYVASSIEEALINEKQINKLIAGLNKNINHCYKHYKTPYENRG